MAPLAYRAQARSHKGAQPLSGGSALARDEYPQGCPVTDRWM
jgi:hypothetical protein